MPMTQVILARIIQPGYFIGDNAVATIIGDSNGDGKLDALTAACSPRSDVTISHRRRDTAASQASRWVCAGDVRMLECSKFSGMDAFWWRSVRRLRTAGFHDAIRPSHWREMAFENPLKEECRMNSQTSPPSPFPDEAAVRALYQQTMDAWNTSSGEADAAQFAEDGDLIGFDGTHFKGRQENAPFHQRLFDTYLKGTLLVGQVTSVRFLSPDVALMHAVGGTVMCGKSAPAPERDSIQTLVATKCGGEWRFAAFHKTRVRPIGRHAAGTSVWILSDYLWKVLCPRT
jgi:uncharacterized protein (TIGR02246 family)